MNVKLASPIAIWCAETATLPRRPARTATSEKTPISARSWRPIGVPIRSTFAVGSSRNADRAIAVRRPHRNAATSTHAARTIIEMRARDARAERSEARKAERGQPHRDERLVTAHEDVARRRG